MARYWFGGTANDGVYTTYTLGSRQLLQLARTTLRFYDAETGGTQYTDLLDADGNPVDSIVTELGQVPRFQGPDGVAEMWADDGDQQRHRMAAIDVTALNGAVTAAETARDDAQTAAAAAEAVGTTNDTIIAGRVNDPASATSAALSATYARRDQLAPLRAALDTGMSAGLQVLGDSTGNDSHDWPTLVAQDIAADYPDVTLKHWLWDDTTQSFAPQPVILQSGTSGERRITIGTQGAYLPGSAFASPSGDLDVRVKVSFDTWPLAGNGVLVNHGYSAGGFSFRLLVGTAESVMLRYSYDGTTNNYSAGASLTGVVTAGTPIWLRFTWTANNGSGSRELEFSYSTDGVSYVAVGTTQVIAGTGGLFPSTQDWELGAEGFSGSVLDGSIYDVEIRDGYGGPNLAPLIIDAWSLRSGSTASRAGAPVLALVNGSHPGASVTYLMDTGRLPKMTQAARQAVCVLSCSHNDGNREGKPYLADWATWLGRIETQLPATQIVVTTQNPQGPTQANREMHATRRWQIANWARRNGLPVVDAYAAFETDPRGLAALLEADDVHPNADGARLWADTLLATT